MGVASCGVIAWGWVWRLVEYVGVTSCGVIAWGGGDIVWCNSLRVGVASCGVIA